MDQPFEGKGNSRFEGFGKKVDEHLNQVGPRVEQEVKKVIAYLNDEVVPQLRQGSSQALRSASETLRRLAEQLDNRPDSGAR
jgi:bisphosphoglycerate-dependent phosphoglycerate mutase